MSNKHTEEYWERIAMIEQDLKDAEEEREKAIEELLQAAKWVERMNAKVNMERINLLKLKQNNE